MGTITERISGQPIAGIGVGLNLIRFPTGTNIWPPCCGGYQKTASDSAGRYEIRGIPPGGTFQVIKVSGGGYDLGGRARDLRQQCAVRTVGLDRDTNLDFVLTSQENLLYIPMGVNVAPQ